MAIETFKELEQQPQQVVVAHPRLFILQKNVHDMIELLKAIHGMGKVNREASSGTSRKGRKSTGLKIFDRQH